MYQFCLKASRSNGHFTRNFVIYLRKFTVTHCLFIDENHISGKRCREQWTYCNMHACLPPLLRNGPSQQVNSGDAC
jgi:hypothetical protein